MRCIYNITLNEIKYLKNTFIKIDIHGFINLLHLKVRTLL